MADIFDKAQENAQRWIDNVISARPKISESVATNMECLECGEPISPARREAAPYATRCVECQSYVERYAR